MTQPQNAPSRAKPDPRVERQEGIVTVCKPMGRFRPLRLRYVGNKDRMGRGRADK
jgi:hypothetical protein